MTEAQIDVWENGDLVWVLALSAKNLGWSVQAALVTDIVTREILINGTPKTWDALWYKTEEEAEAALTEKLNGLKGLFNNLSSVQPMSLPAGLIFFMEYTYGKKEDDSEQSTPED